MSKQHSISQHTSRLNDHSNEEISHKEKTESKTQMRDKEKAKKKRLIPMWWFEPFTHKDDSPLDQEE